MDESEYQEFVETELEDWRKAGRIANEALVFGGSLIKKGASLLEVSNKIEDKIKSLGGELAFPTQISCDHIAAHYCADHDDDVVFEDQLACLDVGVHINGAIGDNAMTIDLSGKNTDLVKASRDALNAVSKILQIGLPLGEIGKTIQEVIESYGFNPISNLGGHGLDLFEVHTAPTIPNVDNKDPTILKKGRVIAIEPFATTGKGLVSEAEQANIYAVVGNNPVRSPYARQILQVVKNNNGLPFTSRWLLNNSPLAKVTLGLRELLQKKVIRQYPPLIEVQKGLVSQAEHTFLIDDKVEILTDFH